MPINVRVDTYAAQGAARRMAEHYNLNVKFDLDEGRAPYADGKTIHLSPPNAHMSNKDMEKWWGTLIHETRHMTPRGRGCFKLAGDEKIDMNSLHGGMLNLFEDSCVDNVDTGKFIGQDETAAQFASTCFDEVLKSENAYKSVWHNPTLEKSKVILGTSLLLSSKMREIYQPTMVGRYKEILEDPKLNADIKKMFEDTCAKGLTKELEELTENVEKYSTRDVWDWTKRYLDEVFDEPPPPPKTKSDGSDGNEEGNGEDKADTAGKSKDKEVELDKEFKKDRAIFEEFFDDHEPDLSKRQKLGDLHYENYARKGSMRYNQPGISDIRVVDCQQKKIFDGAGRSSATTPSYSQIISVEGSSKQHYEMIKTSDSLANQVKRYIQTESRVKITRNIKKGKIDGKKLFKLGVPDTPAEWQERVFWDKFQKKSCKETVISIGGDYSGSMSGTKIWTAIHALDLLSEVMTTLKINHEVWGFTTMGRARIHMLFKKFGERVGRTHLVERMIGGTRHMSNNNDGDHVLFAYHRLLKAQAKRRIMIILSDGCPAGPGGDIDWWTREVTNSIAKARLVELHGIGIQDSSVENYYGSYNVIKRTNELEGALLEVLKNKVIKEV